ncbi:hypothetical protein TWF696_006766 [Orbilia brochopaga]|uniref:Uncharacterized protein n=1 Tax=Orbilia brochopaga TaxID=3140254 RepID=A0AAV9UPQ3_9PEZI
MIVSSCIFLSFLSICRALPQARSTPSSLTFLPEPYETVPNTEAVEIVDETNLIFDQPNNLGVQPVQPPIEDAPLLGNEGPDQLWDFLGNSELDSNGLELDGENINIGPESRPESPLPYNPTWQTLIARLSALDLESLQLANLGLAGTVGNNNPPVVSQIVNGEVYDPIEVSNEALQEGLGYVDQPYEDIEDFQPSPNTGAFDRRLAKRDTASLAKRSLVKRAETTTTKALWDSWFESNYNDFRFLYQNINLLFRDGRILIRDGLESQPLAAPANAQSTTATMETPIAADPNPFLEETFEPIYDALISYGELSIADLAKRLFNYQELADGTVLVDDTFVSTFGDIYAERALAFSLVAQNLSPNVHRKLFTNTPASAEFERWAKLPSGMGVNKIETIIELSIAIDRIIATFADLSEEFSWVGASFGDITFDIFPDFSDELVVESSPELQSVEPDKPTLDVGPMQQTTTVQPAAEEDVRDLFDDTFDYMGPNFWSGSDDDGILRAWLLSPDT